MDQRPIQSTVTNEFNGQYSDTDAGNCPEGTMYRQVNMMSVVQNQLTTRGGLKEVTLDTLE